MVEQNLFVWAAFMITFLVLALQFFWVVKEACYTQRVLVRQIWLE